MPRFGKDFRMYDRIRPSLYLDISDVLEGWCRMCCVCGALAGMECSDCSGQIMGVTTETIYSFCDDCSEMVHRKRPNHMVKPLVLSAHLQREISEARDKGWSKDTILEKIMAPRKTLELFAVVCIDTSYYVAFVKAGCGFDAKWVFFDSMADREGDQHGYNIPEITYLRDFELWLQNDQLLLENDRELPVQLRRLLRDGYMCMYQDPRIIQENFHEFPTAVDISEIMRNLRLMEEETIVNVPSTGLSASTLTAHAGNPYSRGVTAGHRSYTKATSKAVGGEVTGSSEVTVPISAGSSFEGPSSYTESRVEPGEKANAVMDVVSALQVQLQELKQRVDEQQLQSECMICMDRQRNMVFQCGHSTCSECAQQLDNCPVCKRPIESKIMMYM